MFFKNSTEPSIFLKWVNKYVTIELNTKAFLNNPTKKRTCLHGQIFTIDPISLSLILINDSVVTLVTNDEIIAISEMIEHDLIDTTNLFDSKNIIEDKQSTDDLSLRREKLIDWLTKNHLPVKLDSNNVINILDVCFIPSPYQVDNCESTNEIILDKVRQLILKIN